MSLSAGLDQVVCHKEGYWVALGLGWLGIGEVARFLTLLVIIGALVFVAMSTAVGIVAASAARAPTKAYLGKSKGSAAEITALQSGRWEVDCASGAYEGGEVWLGRRHRAITVHQLDLIAVGFALLRSDGSWAIYRWLEPTISKATKLAGFTVRRSSSRWDIMRGGRKIGYTIGPDGPEAATPLLTLC